MLPNLLAEMAREEVTINDIKNALVISTRTAFNKVNGITEFSVGEATVVRNTFFPNCKIEYLFEKKDG